MGSTSRRFSKSRPKERPRKIRDDSMQKLLRSREKAKMFLNRREGSVLYKTSTPLGKRESD